MALISRRTQPARSRASAGPLLDPALGSVEAELFAAGIRNGSFDVAHEIFAASGSTSERIQMLDAVAATRGRPPEIVDLMPSSATAVPLLVRAWHAIAWAERTGITTCGEMLAAAEIDLIEASRREPDDAIAWIGLITTGRMLELPVDERRIRFDRAEASEPGLLDAHIAHLLAVSAGVGGSDELVQSAVASAAIAPNGSPTMHALVALAGIVHLIDTAERPSDYFDADRTATMRKAAEASVLQTDFAERVPWREAVQAANIFAFGLALCEEMTAAQTLFDRIGDDLVSDMPWKLHGDGIVERYVHVRNVTRRALREGGTGPVGAVGDESSE